MEQMNYLETIYNKALDNIKRGARMAARVQLNAIINSTNTSDPIHSKAQEALDSMKKKK